MLYFVFLNIRCQVLGDIEQTFNIVEPCVLEHFQILNVFGTVSYASIANFGRFCASATLFRKL